MSSAPTSYDKAKWHYGGDFPADLPPEVGSTHIGMFFAWMANKGFAGEIHTTEFPTKLQALKDRVVTPGAYVRNAMDETMSDEDFTDEGNAFAKHYYGGNLFYADLETACKGLPSIYHLPDTWDSYALISPKIEKAFQKWKPRKLLDFFRR